MTLSDYERQVGPLNKSYHEQAEMIVCYKEGILPMRPDEDDQPDTDTGKKDKARRPVSRSPPQPEPEPEPDKRDRYQCNDCGDPLDEPGALCEHCSRAASDHPRPE